jgi:hypothetical protein
MVPVALRAPSTMPAPQPCSVLIPCFEVTNSETAGLIYRFNVFNHSPTKFQLFQSNAFFFTA